MNIELVKYKSGPESKILYAFISEVTNQAASVHVELSQYKSQHSNFSVEVPEDKVTTATFGDSGLFLKIDITDIAEINKSDLFLLSVEIGDYKSDYPVYDSNAIVVAKMDMINIMSNNELTDAIVLDYVKLMFIESGLRDTAKYSDIIECNKFYIALSELVRSFKTKYYYNEKAK